MAEMLETRFLQRTSARGPYIPFLTFIYFDEVKNNSTKAARIVITFHTVPREGYFNSAKGVFLVKQPSSWPPWRIFLYILLCWWPCTCFLSLYWIHSRTLMWSIQIHRARDTYSTLEHIYVFILPFFSLSVLYFHSADALLWHLCEWGLQGWDSQRCLNDSLAIAVMCAVNSQRDLRGVQIKEMSLSSS